ncbi:hypothetical protein KIN20_009050 [Parelaphostrongylus tenuis]|uniref:Uncharacterized protein n=1 Tax=Parelaphostrongylus tenuis TaxID=148309 RepID=A0AAD5MRA1_PARTN|nr:hypothetical protein KIN20_009050 [Parelaphostrongylus tenuis]
MSNYGSPDDGELADDSHGHKKNSPHREESSSNSLFICQTCLKGKRPSSVKKT